jgi:hypothetical protein
MYVASILRVCHCVTLQVEQNTEFTPLASSDKVCDVISRWEQQFKVILR